MTSFSSNIHLDRADPLERLPEEGPDEDEAVEDDEGDADDGPRVQDAFVLLARASDHVEAEEDNLLQQQAEDDEMDG